MTTAALAIGAALAVLVVLAVARPFLREPAPADDALDEPGELERRRLTLTEERDRALAALKELEFDHRTGKISDDEFFDRMTARYVAAGNDPVDPREAQQVVFGRGMVASAAMADAVRQIRDAGYKTALQKQFTVTANSSGQIVIAFTHGTADNPFISGIERSSIPK